MATIESCFLHRILEVGGLLFRETQLITHILERLTRMSQTAHFHTERNDLPTLILAVELELVISGIIFLVTNLHVRLMGACQLNPGDCLTTIRPDHTIGS